MLAAGNLVPDDDQKGLTGPGGQRVGGWQSGDGNLDQGSGVGDQGAEGGSLLNFPNSRSCVRLRNTV